MSFSPAIRKLRSKIRWVTTVLKWRWRAVSPLWRRGRIDAWSAASGVGDELMALGVMQSVAESHPECELVFHCRHAALVEVASKNLTVKPYEAGALPKEGVSLYYLAWHSLPLMEQMARLLGGTMKACPITLPRRSAADFPPGLPHRRKTVVLQTVASAWTPNKQWPAAHWVRLLELLPPDLDVLEIGTESIFPTPPSHPGYQSLVGKTSLLQFAAVIQEAQVFVGPVSSGMHLAHAYGVPSVVIIGGYELPHPYPLAKSLFTGLPCSPCWLRGPCPYDLKCLRQIPSEEVLQAILEALARPPEAASGLTPTP